MIDGEKLEAFLADLARLDPLDASWSVPIYWALGKTTPAHMAWLPSLFAALEKTFEPVEWDGGDPRTSFPYDWQQADQRSILMDLIMRIDRHPSCVPPLIRRLLNDDETEYRKLALKYALRAQAIDEETREHVRLIAMSHRTWLGSLWLALRVLWKHRKRRVTPPVDIS